MVSERAPAVPVIVSAGAEGLLPQVAADPGDSCGLVDFTDAGNAPLKPPHQGLD